VTSRGAHVSDALDVHHPQIAEVFVPREGLALRFLIGVRFDLR